MFILAMLNVSALDSLRGLPVVAQYGLQSVGYYFLVAIFFLIPSGLISAELATGWPHTCGVNTWVKEAFGPRWGFFAVWMQWIHNVTWFPTILSFIAATLAYLFVPELAENKFYLIAVILIGCWGFTIINFFGVKTSALVSTVCVILGTIIPGAIMVALDIYWVLTGHPIETPFTLRDIIPRVSSIGDLAFLGAMVLSFGGLELSAVHVDEIKNPQKNFPKAILIAALIALFMYAGVAVSISIVIPQSEINFISGLIQTFSRFMSNLGLSWCVIPIGVMITLGAVAELNSWIIGPVRAIHATSKQGILPEFFSKENKYKMPENILFIQAMVVTLVSFVFLCMPSTSSAFWILSAMSVQLYLLMYILMFAAVIRLRYSHPHIKRHYKIPFGRVGVWIVGSLGLLSAVFTFFITFVPPSQIAVGNHWFYEGFLVGGIAVMCIIPHLVYHKSSRRFHSKKH
jgi:putative glutamate/gamma-aminobutyrate antiporter